MTRQATTSTPVEVRFGQRTQRFPSTELGELRESQGLLGDVAALRRRMAEDGYLLLRGLIDREKVARARQTILEHMRDHEALVPGTPLLEGAMPDGARSINLLGRAGVTHHRDVRAVFEGHELFDFWNAYFGRPSLTFDYKWLRAVGNEQFTGAHYDVVYMGEGSGHVHTNWIPFGDIDPEQGTLAICVGSHAAPGFARLRETYGRMDVDRDRIAGWFSDDPMEIVEKFGGRWATARFRMGDVLIFGMYTMHASTTNQTTRYRLSADVRFQPADDPVDRRWVGENPTGHDRWMSEPEKVRSMAECRREWGV